MYVSIDICLCLRICLWSINVYVCMYIYIHMYTVQTYACPCVRMHIYRCRKAQLYHRKADLESFSFVQFFNSSTLNMDMFIVVKTLSSLFFVLFRRSAGYAYPKLDFLFKECVRNVHPSIKNMNLGL